MRLLRVLLGLGLLLYLIQALRVYVYNTNCP